MKKLFLLNMVVLMTVFVNAQDQNGENKNQGLITYEEVIQLNIEFDGLTEQMQAMMPTENRSEKILYFNKDASRYENSKTNENDLSQNSEDGGIMIMMSQPDEIFFRDLKNKSSIEQKEFMTRIFLIEAENEKKDWKLTGKQKMILDFPCQEAIIEDSNKVTSVWFTPAIPISTGPANYAGLPGIILSVESDSGNRTITAKSIEFKEIDEKEMKKPKKGKKVSKEKFMAIVKEKTKEMGNEAGEGTMVIMEIQN